MGNEQGKEKGAKKGGKDTPPAATVDDDDDDEDDEDEIAFEEEEPSEDVKQALAELDGDGGEGGHDGGGTPTHKPASRSPAGDNKLNRTASSNKLPKTASSNKLKTSRRASAAPRPAAKVGSSGDVMKQYCKTHGLTSLSYVDLVDLRTALENDQPTLLAPILQRCRLTPASKPYHPLAYSRLEQNHNTILHFIVLHSSIKCYELMQQPADWDRTGTWKPEMMNAAFDVPNRHGITPRNKIVQMLSDAMQRLPPNFRSEMSANDDTKTIIPGASMAMANLSSEDERSPEELHDLLKKAFDTFIHLRAVRTSHDLLISRRGEVVLHNHDSKESSSSSDDTSSGPAGGRAAGDERAAAAIAEEVQHNRKLLASKGYNGPWLASTRVNPAD